MGDGWLQGVESGSGEPTLVLLHGYAATGFTWRHWVPELERSHRVLNLDLKGFGRSGSMGEGGFSPEDHAAAVLHTLDALGVGDLVLVGHSLGGGIALLTALSLLEGERAARLRGLILVSAAAYVDRIPPFVRIARAGALGRIFFRLVPKELLVRTVLRQVQSPRHPPENEAVAGYAQPFHLASHRAACLSTALEIIPPHHESIVERYPEVRVPTLLLWGDRDRVTSPSMGQRLAAALPHTEFHVIPECGHVPQDEHPAETLELVTRFLGDLPAPPD